MKHVTILLLALLTFGAAIASRAQTIIRDPGQIFISVDLELPR